jgi:hypothetical protein
MEITDRVNGRNTVILALFLASIGTLILTMVIFFPVVNSVTKTRVEVLSLFVDIPI